MPNDSDFSFAPKLVDFGWQVNVKASSNAVPRMAIPTCLLKLEVQEPPNRVDEEPNVNIVAMELSKETLHTMLDGLGKIREQLSSVAK